MVKKQMNFRFFAGTLLFILILASLAACASAPAVPVSAAPQAAANTSAGAAVSFSKNLLPIINTTCVNCHGGEKTSKGLDMKTYASLMAGSQNGAMIVAGDAANSKLVQSIQSGKMPKRGNPLTADQVQLFVNWVNAGAMNN
jgi:uncharacterized membrane protein